MQKTKILFEEHSPLGCNSMKLDKHTGHLGGDSTASRANLLLAGLFLG
jgi:hypothetical protein